MVWYAYAHHWFSERLERAFTLPEVDRASLSGVGFVPVQNGLQIPTLFFEGATPRQSLRLYVVDYALLNAEREHLRLGREEADALASDALPDVVSFPGRSASLVRHRDDIYAIVASELDITLGSRLHFAGR